MRKNFLPLLVALSLALTNCSSQEEQEAAEVESSNATSVEPEATETEPATSESSTSDAPEPKAAAEATASSNDNDDCDKFLTNYEEYADSYAVLAAKYAKNPMDMSIMQEYTEMATKAQEMQQDKPDACEANAAFMKRYLRITSKVSKAAAAQAAGSAKMLEQMSK